MKYSLSDILKKANDISDVNERIIFIQSNNSSPMQTFLTLAFDPALEWAVPETDPPYKASEYVDAQGMIFNNSVLRQIKCFIKGQGQDNVSRIKREQIFIQFLETVDKDDAELFLFIKKNKKLPFRKLNKTFISKAFPDLIDWSKVKDTE